MTFLIDDCEVGIVYTRHHFDTLKKAYNSVPTLAQQALMGGVMALSIFGFSHDGYASEQPCAQGLDAHWSLPLTENHIGKKAKDVFASPEFGMIDSFLDDDDRMTIDTAPDGKPALRMNIPIGEVERLGITLEAFEGDGIQHACLALKVYLAPDFDFATASTKLGWGLWGGRGTNDSGGVPPELQKGWTVRNATNGPWGSKIYSYHLNRNNTRYDISRCDPYGCMYGKTTPGSGSLPSGRWFDVNLEVRTNDIGQSNGYSKLWIDGTFASELTGLIFRDESRNWMVRGLQISDMWGGDTSAPQNFSPRYQYAWYNDYRIIDMDRIGESTIIVDQQLTNIQQISPNSDIYQKNIQFIWEDDVNIDSYQIKILDSSNNTIHFENRNRSGYECNTELKKCTYNFEILEEGTYYWRLRYKIGNISYDYIDKMEFSFKEENSNLEKKLIQLNPSGDITSANFDFIWHSLLEDAYYTITINDKDTGKKLFEKTIRSSSASCGYELNNCILRGLRGPAGNYTWTLVAETEIFRSSLLTSQFSIIR